MKRLFLILLLFATAAFGSVYNANPPQSLNSGALINSSATIVPTMVFQLEPSN